MKDEISKSQRALQRKNLENGQATDAKVNILPRWGCYRRYTEMIDSELIRRIYVQGQIDDINTRNDWLQTEMKLKFPSM